MVRSSLIGFAALALCACAKPAENREAPADPLVGTWSLERYVDAPEGAAPVYAFGEDPAGIVVFTEGGDFTVSFMRNPPGAEVADPDPDSCHPAWYCSYFGEYSVDRVKGEFAVIVEGGNIPSYLGTTQTRPFEFAGDRLIIGGEYEDGEGREVRYERVFVRR